MHFIRLALRHLRKRPLFSFLNLLGLTVSLTGAMLIGQYVHSELLTDSFLPDQEHTFRLLRTSNINNEPYNIGVTSAPFKDGLLTDFPEEIQSATRVRQVNNPVLGVEENRFTLENVLMVDSNFMDFFGLPLVRGDKSKALSQPQTAVMTAEAADRIFGGDTDPIGKSFQLGTSDPFTLTGIISAPPTKSHLEYDVLISIISYSDSNWWQEWWWNSLGTYVKLDPTLAASTLESQFPAFMDKYFGDDFEASGNRIGLKLEPVADTYFAAETRYDFVKHGNRRMVNIFALVALLLIGIGCANYINLTTAKTTERAKSIAVLRALGASKYQIRWQLLTEGCVLAVLASSAAVVLSQFFGSVFDAAFNFEMPLLLSAWQWAMIALVAALVITLLGVWFPAHLMSKLNLQTGLTSDQRTTGGLRRVLVAAQFVLSITLICTTLLISEQLEYLQQKPLGFTADGIITASAYNDDIYDARERVADWLEQQDAIQSVSFASGEPGGFHDASTIDIEGLDRSIRMRTLFTGGEYIDALGISIIAGRNFDPLIASDSTQAALINRRSLLEMGLDESAALGRVISVPMFDSIPKRIIGIVEDYHFSSLHSEIEPLIITQADWPAMMVIETEPGKSSEAIAALETSWDRFSPNFPLNYNHLEDALTALYAEEQQAGQLLSFFAYLAIFVSCLGIFGLSAFAAARRVKEISIRKVLGASFGNLATLLLKDFVFPISIALVLAIPVSWFFMSRWLDSFVYHTTIGWQLFAYGGCIAISLALLTVSFQSIRVIQVNPVDNLRKE